jgi:hypothetical protein
MKHEWKDLKKLAQTTFREQLKKSKITLKQLKVQLIKQGII